MVQIIKSRSNIATGLAVGRRIHDKEGTPDYTNFRTPVIQLIVQRIQVRTRNGKNVERNEHTGLIIHPTGVSSQLRQKIIMDLNPEYEPHQTKQELSQEEERIVNAILGKRFIKIVRDKYKFELIGVIENGQEYRTN